MLLIVACVLAIYTVSIFNVAASGRSVEDLVGVFSIQKTIKLGSNSECFAGSQSSSDSLSPQNNGLSDNQPPGLAGLSIEPKAIKASSSQSINLTAHIVDDQSGLAEGSGSNLSTAWFVSPSGRQVIGTSSCSGRPHIWNQAGRLLQRLDSSANEQRDRNLAS